MKTVGWFSTGGDSAVAIKLMIDQIDEIIYIHIGDQHHDSLRFKEDCESWYDRPITVIQSPYESVEAACMKARYINGAKGAACTRILKREVRMKWEYERPLDEKLRYVWGIDCTEQDRLYDPKKGLIAKMPNQDHVSPLIDKNITKAIAHEILSASGIKRPAMYDLGYHNNNCIGCVKGGKGYWNKIRRDFPDVFDARAKMEREIGATCIKEEIKGPDGKKMFRRVFLDELKPNAGRKEKPITGDCGILCELMAI